jgi:hypothetical protein
MEGRLDFRVKKRKKKKMKKKMGVTEKVISSMIKVV